MAMLSPAMRAERDMKIDGTGSYGVDMIVAHLGDRYVKNVTVDGQIYYTDLFYEELGQKVLEGCRHKEAIVSLGLDPEVLGEDRVTSACRRAMKKAENKKPFDDLHPGDYDGREDEEEAYRMFQNGEIDKDELLSRVTARLAYLKAENKVLKKNRGMNPGEGLF